MRGQERDCKSHLQMIGIQICLCVRGVNFLFQVHRVALVLNEAVERRQLGMGREEGDAPALENCLEWFLTLGLQHCSLFVSCATVTNPSGLSLNLTVP